MEDGSKMLPANVFRKGVRAVNASLTEVSGFFTIR
jgi:hypothetical protein